RGLPRAVALVTALQFLGQLIGIAFASSADRFGAEPLLLLQAGLLLIGCLAVRALPEALPHPAAASTGFWRSMAEGVVVAARSEQVWPVLLINFGVGVFYVGPFMAVLPLAVRDVYAGGALELSYVNLAFWAATILASMALVGLARRLTLRGRLIAAAVSAGFVILFALSTLPPFPVFVGLIFVWGIGAGVTMTQSRTVVQIVAPASHRARLMSLFQLGIGGGGPIGAFLTGSICALWGLQAAMLLPAAGMVLLVLVILFRSRLWSMRTVE
ncbi:MAG: MFS transporter, partial [Reyranella sp.]